MKYYINCIKKEDTLSRELKELVPNMNMRRRMSRVIKMGVSTALDSWMDFESEYEIDGVVTATHLGCIEDSEKFLRNMIEQKEELLNPTPFIQSTFNTVGGQIALIKGFHGYNNTFVHRDSSFESALLDAIIQLDYNGSKAILVGVFEEKTETTENIYGKLGYDVSQMGDGAVFFVLTKEELCISQASITLDINTEAQLEHPRTPNCLRNATALYAFVKNGASSEITLEAKNGEQSYINLSANLL